MGAETQRLNHEELVARARSLVPTLRSYTGQAEMLRKLPPESVAAVKEAGLYKVLQARRHGGYQMSLRTHIDTIAEVSRGCTSTAWCMAVTQAHSWLMALFPEQAQKETYGANPDALISAVIAPRGKARAVDGGYILNGFWPFASGCEHAQWLFLGATVSDVDGQPVDEADLLVPTSDVAIKDDWNVIGLRGTGSCSVVVEDVFVPAHRYLSLPATIMGEAPGIGLHEGWLYRSAPVPVLALALAPPALGAAETAMEAFKERLPGRTVSYTQGEVQLEIPATHMQAAKAATKIGIARLLLYRCADAIQAAAEAGEEMPLVERARVRMDCAQAVRECLEAVEILYLASGGSGISESSPIGRAWRDLHAINMHGLLTIETNLEMYGRVLLGLEPNTRLI